jgi:uncharacterized protein DUF4265
MTATLRKIAFRLDPAAPNQPQGVVETLWALPVGKDRYRLRNSPGYAYGVSFDDVVFAPASNGRPTFESVVKPGGHFTLRARVWNVNDVPSVESRLNELRCGAETDHEQAGHSTLMAIDVPSESALAQAREYLNAELSAGRLDYEESAVPTE